jgi:hypothetical protein
MRRLLALLFVSCAAATAVAGNGVHTTYLWHMHQPIYWPDASTWNPGRYETVYETIVLGHSQNDESAIFDKDDRVGDYQHYPKDAVSSISDLSEAGAQVSFAGALMENLFSLGNAGWNGGRYATNWYQSYRDARGWLNSAGRPRLEPVLVGFHHAIGPLLPEAALRMELALAREIYGDAWGGGEISHGFFPAEMCFSERMIPLLVEAGVDWSIVGDTHLARACADYPYQANLDNCDPPNPADRTNPAQGAWRSQTISRGVTVKTPLPFGFTPHRARYVDPATGAVSEIVVVPASNAMSWEEGYGLYGTGDVDAIASCNDPARPMLALFAHDGDNAWSGGNSYYYENVTGFSHAAAAAGYTPTTVATYLQHHPVPAADVVHVEDGGWVNADGDFGSPQFINWNWPLVDAAGAFDIPGGWAEDERNWAVLTAAQNIVETASGAVAPRPAYVLDPLQAGTTDAERAWHFLLAGYESGYMYYGAAVDMEIKPTLACNRAIAAAQAAGTADAASPTVWLPQRLPWNPGGFGGGALWGYPGGDGEPMPRDFHVWTFVHDVSGLARVELMVREDADGANDPATHDNELYAGGPGVGAWTALAMNRRVMPTGEPWPLGEIDFTVLPTAIADEYWLELTGYADVLLDYYVEAEDLLGHVTRSPLQHVYVGDGEGGGTVGSVVRHAPDPLESGASAAVWYDPSGRPLAAAASVLMHWGINGWSGVTDTAMAWDDTAQAWRADVLVPASTLALDCVFTDGAGTWDNNVGADWHLAVEGGGTSVSPFLMDGQPDVGVYGVHETDCGAFSLWIGWQDPWLYVATDAGTVLPGRDVFVLLGAGSSPPHAAPWAKSGQAWTWDAFLAAEGDNGWSGWFDAAETTPPTGRYYQVRGAVLEGAFHIDDLWPVARPLELVASVGVYASPAGGALLAQCPTGDGDGDLEAFEAHSIWVPVGVESAPAPREPRLTAAPNPFNPSTTLLLRGAPDGVVKLSVHDAAGRVVRRLEGRSTGGEARVVWDGRDDDGRGLPSGAYFVRSGDGNASCVTRVVLLK